MDDAKGGDNVYGTVVVKPEKKGKIPTGMIIFALISMLASLIAIIMLIYVMARIDEIDEVNVRMTQSKIP